MEKTQPNKKETGKFIKICFFLFFLLILQEVLLISFDKKNSLFFQWQKKWFYANAIEEGLKFYTPENQNSLRLDEYFLLKKISVEKNFAIQVDDEKFSTDSFRRLLNKNNPVDGLKFKRNNFKLVDKYTVNNSFYEINGTAKEFFVDPTDDVVLKSLYCDMSGYDDADFGILKLLNRGDGGYLNTHFLLSLLLLKSNQCYDAKKVEEQINLAVENIVAAEKADTEFSDLYAERIVFLYWAGYGGFVEKEWVDKIKNSMTENSTWQDKKNRATDAHATGLSILAMLYYAGSNEATFSY
jgi:hypothetical protein